MRKGPCRAHALLAFALLYLTCTSSAVQSDQYSENMEYLTIFDRCAHELQIPKVAMMFLTKGDLYHTALWELWFKYLEGYLPLAQVQATCAESQELDAAREACMAHHEAGGSILAKQHLFSVYVHVGLNNDTFQGFPKDSLWHGRAIKERVMAEWGTHSLVTASRNLLARALDEPLNQKFLLLSEAGIPLYSGLTLYHQLMTEEKSRINACPLGERDERRWTQLMETESMNFGHWRKSSQWFALSRAHAVAVMADTEIDQVFQQYCFPEQDDNSHGGWRDCYSDEHYIPTLLSVLGKEDETDCKGYMTAVDWTQSDDGHPRHYHPEEISAERLRELRAPANKCGYQLAIWSSLEQFVKQDQLDAATCTIEVPEYSRSLGPQCPLLARKFGSETADAVRGLAVSCEEHLGLVQGDACPLASN